MKGEGYLEFGYGKFWPGGGWGAGRLGTTGMFWFTAFILLGYGRELFWGSAEEFGTGGGGGFLSLCGFTGVDSFPFPPLSMIEVNFSDFILLRWANFLNSRYFSRKSSTDKSFFRNASTVAWNISIKNIVSFTFKLHIKLN